MNHPGEARLHDFVDEELSGEDRALIASHLADCPTCRGVVTGIRELREQAQRVFRLPATEGVAPPPDHWDRVRDRLSSFPGSRGGGTDRPAHAPASGVGLLPGNILRMAAVIALLVGVSSATTWLLMRPGPAQDGGVSPTAGSSVVATGTEAASRERVAVVVAAYQPVITDLERLLDEGRGRLSAETIIILEENLRIIDAAIADVEDALALDPAQPGVLRSLDGALQAKLHLLREAVGLTRGA